MAAASPEAVTERGAGQGRGIFIITDSRVSSEAPAKGPQVALQIVISQMGNAPHVSNLHPAVLVLCLSAYRIISILILNHSSEIQTSFVDTFTGISAEHLCD